MLRVINFNVMNNINFSNNGIDYLGFCLNCKKKPSVCKRPKYLYCKFDNIAKCVPKIPKVASIEFYADDTTTKITQLQALIRGWQTRNEIFLPWQILPFIQNNLKYESSVQQMIARIICIELNKICGNIGRYKGKTIKLEPQSDAYIFKVPEGELSSLDRPFSLCIEIDKDGNYAQLLLLPGEMIGKGANKAVYLAHEMEFQRKLDFQQRQASYAPAIGIVKLCDAIERGYAIQKEIISEVPEGKFASVPKLLQPSDQNPKLNIVYKDIWYHSDLYHGIINGSIRANITNSTLYVPFRGREQLAKFVEMAKTLEALHLKGYVHRDVKPGNIFLKLDEGSKVEACLADFDFAQKMGISNKKGDYLYWDVLSVNGLVFPTTDAYGLVFSMAQAFLPSLQKSGLEKDPFKILKKKKFECIRNLTASKCAESVLVYNSDPMVVKLQRMFKWVHDKKDNVYSFAQIYAPNEIAAKIKIFRQDCGSSLCKESVEMLLDLEKQIEMRLGLLNIFRNLMQANDSIDQLFVNNYNFYSDWKAMAEEDPQAFYKNCVLKYFPTTSYIKEAIENLEKLLH